MILGLFLFSLLAGHLAIGQKALETRYCMTDCCDPTSYDPSTNGRCWDCQGTGHAHGISESGKVL